jgi:HK97 family phage prohead protease
MSSTRSTITLKAATTGTVEADGTGTFVACVSAGAIDREHDEVLPSAVMQALDEWALMRKRVPLSWSHSLDEGNIIGTLDPATAHEVGDEVIISGVVDRTVPKGIEAWRLIRGGSCGFSIGFMCLASTPRPGGRGKTIRAIDLFEVAVTVTPANQRTRVMSSKSLGVTDLDADIAAVEAHARSHGFSARRTSDLSARAARWAQDLFQ